MKKNLTRIAPLRAGIILGILYGIFSLLLVPFFLLAAMFSVKTGTATPAFMSVGFAIVLPVVYAFFGFIGGIIMAALYNWIAGWTGGFEFEVKEVAPTV